MRISIAFVLLLFSTTFCKQFPEENVECYKIVTILEEDRCIYKSGDLLLYSCSDGSTDTVYVVETRFYYTGETAIDWFGNEHCTQMDRVRIIIEKNDGEWFKAIMHDSFNLNNMQYFDSVNCINIQTYDYDSNRFPQTSLQIACDEFGGLPFAGGEVTYSETYINHSLYQNVFSYTRDCSDSAKYEILWNLKYGVIRFSEFVSGAWTHWDLEGKVPEPM